MQLPAGTSTLWVLSLNSHGNRVFSLRFVDERGLPVPNLKFGLPNDPFERR